MPTYEYIAKDQTGKPLKGTLEADNRQLLLDRLRKENLIIISIREMDPKKAKVAFASPKVRIDDLVVFSRQLATMVDAGIPILGSLDILTQQSEDKAFKQVLARVKADVETGSSLSSAFSKHPRAFSELYVSMVRAGESSGMLDEILDRLATYLEKTSALQKKIKSALVYPAIVTIMAFGITALLLLKVIPVFKGVFSGFGAELPGPTLILIQISDVFRKFFPFVLALLVLAVFLLRYYLNTNTGRLNFDRLLLRLPVFGMLFAKVAVSKFTRTLSTLVRSGVPILACMEVVSKTCGNRVFELAVDSVRLSVKEGEGISAPLGKSRVFPPMVVKMIAVGEQTGELEKMLEKVSDFYDAQVDSTVSALTSMIEPLIIAFLGIIIGAIVICMFLPIFRIATIINM